MGPATSQRTARIEFRMPQYLKAEVEEAAELLGGSITSFAMQALLERARKVKRLYGHAVPCDEERDVFIKVILSPPEPSEALKETLRVKSVTG